MRGWTHLLASASIPALYHNLHIPHRLKPFTDRLHHNNLAISKVMSSKHAFSHMHKRALALCRWRFESRPDIQGHEPYIHYYAMLPLQVIRSSPVTFFFNMIVCLDIGSMATESYNQARQTFVTVYIYNWVNQAIEKNVCLKKFVGNSCMQITVHGIHAVQVTARPRIQDSVKVLISRKLMFS